MLTSRRQFWRRARDLYDSRTLARRLGELASDERQVQVEFLLHLEEFDGRRAWLELGYGSLWTYCLEVLHLREASAWRRIAAMKVLRRFPKLAGALREGRLCLSTLASLGRVLTEENAEELVARAAYRTTAEVDHLDPAARGGEATLDRLRLLCREHNLLHAEKTYGREHMRKYRKGESTSAAGGGRAVPMVREGAVG